MQNMKASKGIQIKDVTANGNRITAKLACSTEMEKYFINHKFFVEYEYDLEGLDKSILCIPVISTIITLAWATGSDIYLNTIDSNYLNNLEIIKTNYKDIFAALPFSTKFHVDKVQESEYSTGKNALLFSAGIDSLYSYITKKSLDLDLITIWGSDIPLDNEIYWDKYKERIIEISEMDGKRAHFIKSNMRHIVDDSLLMREHTISSWWGLVSHGLMLLGQCAPLTAYNHIGDLFISSSGKGIRDGVNILTSNAGSWGATKCSVVGFDKLRQEKINQIVKDPSYLRHIKVCWESQSYYNCGKCEKCSRTQLGLISEGVDISLCDFFADENLDKRIKNLITNKENYLSLNKRVFWEDIQRNIPSNLENVKPEYRDILAWFKNCDLQNLFTEKIEYAIVKRENDIIKLTNQLNDLSAQNKEIKSPSNCNIQTIKKFVKFEDSLARTMSSEREIEMIRNSLAWKNRRSLLERIKRTWSTICLKKKMD